MYHEEGSLIFKLEHLDEYAIVKKKEPWWCKKQLKLAMNDLYRRQQSQWILKSKVTSLG
jgi:hypothetical protein